MRIRTIAAALVIGITPLAIVSPAMAKEKPKSTKFDKPAKCVKLSKKGNKMRCKISIKSVTGKPGANGTNGVNGAPGANGKDGANGSNGVGTQGPQGATGANGANGKDGRDGVRWERIVGSCTGTAPGEVMVIDNALKIGLPNVHGAYGQFKMLVENMRLNDVTKLSFRVKLPVTTGSAYLKLKLEGDKFIVFQPGAQGAETTEWTTYNVVSGKVGYSDASAGQDTFTDAKSKLGNLAIKSLEITGGCAGSAIDGPVLVDDVTLNDTVIGFN